MQISDNPRTMSRHVEFSKADIAMLTEYTIGSLANLIAQKWVEENYPKLTKDKDFVETVKVAAAEATGERVADIVGEALAPIEVQQIQMDPRL